MVFNTQLLEDLLFRDSLILSKKNRNDSLDLVIGWCRGELETILNICYIELIVLTILY